MRVEVCGGIASGKTTLTNALAERGHIAAYERFDENPFFTKFYADPEAYAFETEVTYVLQHYSQIREAIGAELIAADFSLALDLAYASVTLQPADRRTFESVFDRIIDKIGPPSLIVLLRCESSVELARIHERHRQIEQSISLNYLDSLDAAIGSVLASSRFRSVPVLSIDSRLQDFRPGGADRDLVCNRVLAALNAGSPGSLT